MTLSHILEERPVAWRQALIAALVLSALIVDGLDLLMLAFVAPKIIAEWQVDKAHFGIALSAALVTMAIGAFVGGRAGDRFGRKAMLAGSVTCFAIATLATSQVHDLTSLTLLRLIGGLGFGAATPNGLALAGEWLPQKVRATISSAVSVASPLGGILAGWLVLQFIPALGWRGCFILSGVIATVIAVLVIAWLPESPAHLAAAGREDKARKAVARILGSHAAASIEFTAPSTQQATRPRLFAHDLIRFHIGLSIAFFSCSYVTFALSSWISVMMVQLGLAFADASRGLLAFNLFAVASAFVMPALFWRRGSRFTMMTAAFTTLAMLGLIGWTAGVGADGRDRLLLAAAGLGLSQGLFNATFYALIMFVYPPSLRASGAGYAMMINRAGGVVSIVTSGIVMNASPGSALPFLGTLAVTIGISLGGVLLIDRHVAARALSSTSGKA